MKNVIESEHAEDGTYVIYLKRGYHNGFDHLAPEHGIYEDTKRLAHARLKYVEPCTCPECVNG